MNKMIDPGIQQCTFTKLSDRLRGIKERWINLGSNQNAILENIILSTEWHEEQLAAAKRVIDKLMPKRDSLTVDDIIAGEMQWPEPQLDTDK